jgi:general secretion pathway protein K
MKPRRCLTVSRFKTQPGAALLMAMLTVALVAVLASTALWQQWRTLSIETAERQAQQAHWLLAGAQDWARVVLREDARSGNIDHPGEPWSMPLQEARLSSFLAANSSGVLNNSDGLADQVFLSGRIIDMQSRLNPRNLVVNGDIDSSEFQIWLRLYRLLGLPEAELRQWTAQLKAALHTHAADNAPLLPQHTEQLSWLGISNTSLARLAPHITVLPAATTVNLNTASAEVLSAVIPGLDIGTARQWENERNTKPWESPDDFRQRMEPLARNLNDKRYSLNTRYFQITGQLRLDSVVLVERSLVLREGIVSKTVWRERRALLAEPGCISTISPPC